MENYPKEIMELEQQFSTQEQCLEYLAALRWPEGFVCPVCEHKTGWKISAALHECAKCHRQTSVLAGTLFERTKIALPKWFRAIWWVLTQKNGISAMGLQRVLGIKSYKTAWTWLHKLRAAMKTPGRSRLSGTIEVDETYVGGFEEGVPGRKRLKKAIVAIAVEQDGKKSGRIRLAIIPNAEAISLRNFITSCIEEGSMLITDAWSGYSTEALKGYKHRVVNVKASGKEADELLPKVHLVASLLKRWLLGTHQGAVSAEHLPAYLDEFVFRYNRRTSASRGLLFYRLLENAVRVKPTRYKNIIKAIRTGPEHPKRRHLKP
jgi:transposase-like protein